MSQIGLGTLADLTATPPVGRSHARPRTRRGGGDRGRGSADRAEPREDSQTARRFATLRTRALNALRNRRQVLGRAARDAHLDFRMRDEVERELDALDADLARVPGVSHEALVLIIQRHHTTSSGASTRAWTRPTKAALGLLPPSATMAIPVPSSGKSKAGSTGARPNRTLFPGQAPHRHWAEDGRGRRA